MAVLGLTACGGSGTSRDTTPSTSTAPTTASPATTTPPTGNDQAGTPFCQLAKTYTERFAALLASLKDPPKLKAAATEAEAAIRQAQATSPAAIKPDVTVVATTASQLLAALTKVSFVYDSVPPADIAKLQDPVFRASLDKLSLYGQAHCGIS